MTERIRIRVFSVDDHPLLREGITAIINSQPDMVMVAQAANARDAMEQFRKHRPDVTLMDLRLPDKNGIDAMVDIRSEFPDARVIVLTTFEGDVEIKRALEAGAHGYMLKSMPPKELRGGNPPGSCGEEADSTATGGSTRRAFERRSSDRARGGGSGADRRRKPESGYRRAPFHHGRNSEGPHQAHHGEAGGKRSHASRRNRHSPRHHPALGRKVHPVPIPRKSDEKIPGCRVFSRTEYV